VTPRFTSFLFSRHVGGGGIEILFDGGKMRPAVEVEKKIAEQKNQGHASGLDGKGRGGEKTHLSVAIWVVWLKAVSHALNSMFRPLSGSVMLCLAGYRSSWTLSSSVAILAVGWTVTITEQSTTMCTSGEKLNGV
jgi:hypothetical protein